VLVAAAAFAFVACGGGGGGSAPSGSASHFITLLNLMPDTPDARVDVTMVDWEKLRAILRVDLPKDLNNDAAVEAFRNQITSGLSANKDIRLPSGLTFISGIDQYGSVVIQPSTIGYGFGHVDAEASAGKPPETYEAIAGRFDPKASEKAIAACKDCPAAEVGTHKGVKYYAWGGDFQQNLRGRLSPPAFDELGRGGRTAFFDRYVLRTNWTAGIQQMISASKGEGSLGANADFKAMAENLASLGAYEIYLSNQTQSSAYGLGLIGQLGSASQIAELRKLWQPASSEPRLRLYTLLGVGEGLDAKGPYLALVLVHPTEQAAKENVDLLKKRIAVAVQSRGTKWSEVITSADLRAEGKLLIGRLDGYRGFTDFIFAAEPLLLHE